MLQVQSSSTALTIGCRLLFPHSSNFFLQVRIDFCNHCNIIPAFYPLPDFEILSHLILFSISSAVENSPAAAGQGGNLAGKYPQSTSRIAALQLASLP
jgi:hypothetical protein